MDVHIYNVFVSMHVNTPPPWIRLAANSTIHVISLNKACNFAILPVAPSTLFIFTLSLNQCLHSQLVQLILFAVDSFHNTISLSCVTFGSCYANAVSCVCMCMQRFCTRFSCTREIRFFTQIPSI